MNKSTVSTRIITISMILVILIISSYALFHQKEDKHIFRKKEVLCFIAKNDLFNKSGKGKVLIFILNTCKPCTEAFLTGLLSLDTNEIVKNKEIVIICQPDTYEDLIQLEDFSNIELKVFENRDLETQGFNLHDDFIYLLNEKVKLKEFYWIGELTYTEFSKVLE